MKEVYYTDKKMTNSFKGAVVRNIERAAAKIPAVALEAMVQEEMGTDVRSILKGDFEYRDGLLSRSSKIASLNLPKIKLN